jgi:hypothetical protein
MKTNSRNRRRLLIVAALLALFSITGFLIAPPILKTQLEKRLSAELDRRVTVEKVRLNPFALSLTLENFAVHEPDGTTHFLGWTRLYVNFDALGSLRGEWVLSEIALDGFTTRVAVNADQSFNFSDLLARLAPPPDPAAAPAEVPAKPAAPSRPVRIASLHVDQAQVAFSDASQKEPFATTLGPLTFTLTEFRTVSERGAPYRFEAVTEANERLQWTGTLQAEPLRSLGELSIENVVLAKYAPYYADRVEADLVAGTLSIRGGYELDLAADRPTLLLKDGEVQIRDLKLLERATKEPALELPHFAITGVQADALAMKAAIGAIVVDGGYVRARREKDGAINLLAMLLPPGDGSPPGVTAAAAPSPPAPAGPGAAPAALPDVTIGELAVKDFRVDLADLAAPRPAQLSLGGVEVSLKNVTLAEGAQMPLQLAFAWAPQGTVRLDGSVAIFPVKAELKVDVAGFDLLPLSPYLEEFVDARLTQGALTATLETRVSMPEGTPLAASVSGNVQVEKLGLVDGAHNEELAGFGALSLRGLRASTTPELSVALDEIDLAAPYARVVVAADKTLNLASVLRVAPEPEPPAASDAAPGAVAVVDGAVMAAVPRASTPAPAEAAPPATAPLPAIEIGKIVISGGDYRFTDRSIEPNVRMAIDQFGGTIAGLSSTRPARGDVDLKAVVDGAGPIAILGKLDPLGAKTAVDLKIDFKNVDLLPLSPYSGRFAGYELAGGKLLLDVKLLVDGAKIDAANVITLNQFTFGKAVESPEATKLPVRLGIALLKDLEGRIIIDVPVQGDLDDPSFGVGRVVLRVITNLLSKAAMSPFTLLGAAFGGGGDELAFQEFAPGSSEIQEAEMKKLQTMVQALTNRPGLSLALDGHYDSAADTYALKRVKLAEQVRRAIWEKKHREDPNIPPPAELVITAEENVAMVKALYDEKFPPGTQFGTPLPAPPEVVAPPPPPSAGIFQRLVRAVTPQAKRELRAAEQENARLTEEHAKAVEAALATGLPFDDMHARLAEAVVIDDNDLRALAQARARRVRDYFANDGGVSTERLFLAKEKTEAADAAAAKGPRVFLALQ